MFEVGKKYIREFQNSPRPLIIEVLNTTDRSAHIRIIQGINDHSPHEREHCYLQSTFDKGWREYKEPVKFVEEQFVFLRPFKDRVFVSLSQPWGSKHSIGKIRMTYTEDLGLEVEVLEGGHPSKT